jgi:hypothetical protein
VTEPGTGARCRRPRPRSTPRRPRARPGVAPRPTTLEREVDGGTIGWVIGQEPRGQSLADAGLDDDRLLDRFQPSFARVLTPDPAKSPSNPGSLRQPRQRWQGRSHGPLGRALRRTRCAQRQCRRDRARAGRARGARAGDADVRDDDQGLVALDDWLASYGVTRVGMESTGC